MAQEISTETVEVEPTARSKVGPSSRLGRKDESAEIDELFEGGPLTRWHRLLGLSRPSTRRLVVRSLVAIAIGWVPLLVINAIQVLVLWG